MDKGVWFPAYFGENSSCSFFSGLIAKQILLRKLGFDQRELGLTDHPPDPTFKQNFLPVSP